MKVLLYAYCPLAFTLATSASAACGMTGGDRAEPRCAVVNGDRLPARSGGVAALCAAIERAAAAKSLDAAFTVKVSVGARSLLSADVTLSDGRKLPSLRMAEMDRPIAKSTLERFGTAIADHVASGRR